jgi:hypothetical protein
MCATTVHCAHANAHSDFQTHKILRLTVHAGMSATVVATGAHQFSLVADALTVGAAILFFSGRDTAARGVCAFLWGCHVFLLGSTDPVARNTWDIGDFDAGSRQRDAERTEAVGPPTIS